MNPIAILIAPTLVLGTISAHACMHPHFDPEGDAQRAEAVLLVRVIKVDQGRYSVLHPDIPKTMDSPALIAHFSIDKLLKGTALEDRRFARPTPASDLRDPIAALDACAPPPLPKTGDQWMIYRYGPGPWDSTTYSVHELTGLLHDVWWRGWQANQRQTARP